MMRIDEDSEEYRTQNSRRTAHSVAGEDHEKNTEEKKLEPQGSQVKYKITALP